MQREHRECGDCYRTASPTSCSGRSSVRLQPRHRASAPTRRGHAMSKPSRRGPPARQPRWPVAITRRSSTRPTILRATGASLTVRRPRGEVDTLEMVEPRTFRAGGLTYRFAPNVNGAAPSFAVDIGRARGMAFNRVPGPWLPGATARQREIPNGAKSQTATRGGRAKRRKLNDLFAFGRSAFCRRSGFRAVWDFAPSGISRRLAVAPFIGLAGPSKRQQRVRPRCAVRRNQARDARTITSNTATAANVGRSVAPTSKSSAAITLVSHDAPSNPTATPTTASQSARPPPTRPAPALEPRVRCGCRSPACSA